MPSLERTLMRTSLQSVVLADELGNGAPSEREEGLGRSLRETVFRLVPAVGSLRGYSWRSLRFDTVAGLTVAAVAVPQAMAYATIAGLPPQYGLYTAIVMTAVGALFDSSRQLINGPTNAICIAMLSVLAGIGGPQERLAAAVLLALLVGLIQTGITLLRMGDLSRYISHAVIVGFTLGAAVLLVLGQLKPFLGLPEAGHAEAHFLVRFGLTMQQVGSFNPWTLGIGLGTVALVIGMRVAGNRLGVRLPDLLLAVAAMALLVWLLQLENRGVKVVGTIPARLPSFHVPDFEGARIRELAGGALAIAVLGLLEAVAMAKAIAAKSGQKLDINQQCLSEGVANIAGSFFQCFPGSGSLTRSAINVQAGAVSQWSGVIAAGAVAVTVLLFARFAYYIPQAALAGILMVSAARLVDRTQLLYHLRTTRFDAGIVLVTAISAVAVSVEFCILIGVFLSFVLYVPRAARVHLTELTLTPERVLRERLPTDPPCNRMRLYSLEGELFFGSAPSLEEHLETIEKNLAAETRVVVLRMKRVRNTDAVCLGLLEKFLQHMDARKVIVLLCGVRHDLARVLRTSGIEEKLGKQRIFLEQPGLSSSTLEAVRGGYELLGNNLCADCPRRQSSPSPEGWYYMI